MITMVARGLSFVTTTRAGSRAVTKHQRAVKASVEASSGAWSPSKR